MRNSELGGCLLMAQQIREVTYPMGESLGAEAPSYFCALFFD